MAKREAPKPQPFAVRCSPYALDYVRRLQEAAFDKQGKEKTGSEQLTAYQTVRACLTGLIPNHALNNRLALGVRGGVRLAGIYRAHAGRLRVCWIASSQLRRAIVLVIGRRKEGDRNDVYADLERLLRGGFLDAYFAELGQQNPLTKPK